MKHEDIINEWISIVESIEVDGFKRKVISKKSNDLGRVTSLSAELTDLSNDDDEDIDYKSRRYSRFCFDFINVFIEKLKTGEVRNNDNWTYIEFYDGGNRPYAYIEYRTFNFIISTDYNKYVELTREKKLKELGL